MNGHLLRFAYCGAVVLALGVAACSSGAVGPMPLANNQGAASLAAASASATPITLRVGTSIGTPTFSDGDTDTGGQGQSVDGHGCQAAMHAIFHIHTHLSIFDPNGNQIMVPMGIGVLQPWGMNSDGTAILTGGCFYHLHTHDHSGVIHDEAFTDEGFTLGDFFDIWGMPLSTTNVAGYTGPVVWVYMYTPGSGVPGSWSSTTDPRTIALSEHLEITLSVGRKFSPVPHYKWGYK